MIDALPDIKYYSTANINSSKNKSDRSPLFQNTSISNLDITSLWQGSRRTINTDTVSSPNVPYTHWCCSYTILNTNLCWHKHRVLFLSVCLDRLSSCPLKSKLKIADQLRQLLSPHSEFCSSTVQIFSAVSLQNDITYDLVLRKYTFGLCVAESQSQLKILYKIPFTKLSLTRQQSSCTYLITKQTFAAAVVKKKTKHTKN